MIYLYATFSSLLLDTPDRTPTRPTRPAARPERAHPGGGSSRKRERHPHLDAPTDHNPTLLVVVILVPRDRPTPIRCVGRIIGCPPPAHVTHVPVRGIVVVVVLGIVVEDGDARLRLGGRTSLILVVVCNIFNLI